MRDRMKDKTNYYFIAIITTYILLLILLFLYFFLFKDVWIIPECIIHKYLDLYCPGCGITRSIISLLKLDILGSLYYNPIVLYSFISVNIYIINEIIYMIFKKRINIPYNIIIKIGLIILIVNCIVKNILGIEMLFIV